MCLQTEPQINEGLLTEIFSRFGAVHDSIIKRHTSTDHPTPRQAGYGFVYFLKMEDAKKVISQLSGDKNGGLDGILFDCKLSRDYIVKMQSLLEVRSPSDAISSSSSRTSTSKDEFRKMSSVPSSRSSGHHPHQSSLAMHRGAGRGHTPIGHYNQYSNQQRGSTYSDEIPYSQDRGPDGSYRSSGTSTVSPQLSTPVAPYMNAYRPPQQQYAIHQHVTAPVPTLSPNNQLHYSQSGGVYTSNPQHFSHTAPTSQSFIHTSRSQQQNSSQLHPSQQQHVSSYFSYTSPMSNSMPPPPAPSLSSPVPYSGQSPINRSIPYVPHSGPPPPAAYDVRYRGHPVQAMYHSPSPSSQYVPDPSAAPPSRVMPSHYPEYYPSPPSFVVPSQNQHNPLHPNMRPMDSESVPANLAVFPSTSVTHLRPAANPHHSARNHHNHPPS